MDADSEPLNPPADTQPMRHTWDWVVATGSVAVLLLAVLLIPIVTQGFGLGFGYAVPVVTGLFVLLALSRTKIGEPSEGRAIYWLSFLSGAAKRYRDERAVAEQANRDNATRFANMSSCLLAYRLAREGLAPPTPHGALETNVIGLTELSERAVSLISDDVRALLVASTPAAAGQPAAAGVPAGDPLTACLRVLFASHYPHATIVDEVDEVVGIWANTKPNVPGLVEMMSRVVSRHGAFTFAADRHDDIGVALKDMRDEHRRFELSEVVRRLRMTPRQLVENMETVAALYGFGPLPPKVAATIASTLLRRPDGERTHVVAEAYAAALYPPESSECAQSARQLELLYGEHFHQETGPLWHNFDDAEKDSLASLLCLSGPLATGTAGQSETMLRVLLGVVRPFDVGVLRAACVRIDDLHCEVAGFVADSVANDLTASPKWAGPAIVDSLAGYLRDDDALPTSEPELVRLDAPELVTGLIRHVALEMIGPDDPDAGLVCVDAQGVPNRPPEADRDALAFSSTGLYLLAGHRRPDLRSVLGAQARASAPGVASLGDYAARVLLARMWRRRHAVDSEEELRIPLAELLCKWPAWLEGAKNEYKERLTKNLLATVRQQVRHGDWPTRLPFQWMLEQSADRIIDAMHTDDATSAPLVRQIQADMEALQQAVANEATAKEPDVLDNPLIDIIKAFDPSARLDQQAQALADLSEALEDSRDDRLDELLDAVHLLEVTDERVVKSIGRLEKKEHEVIGAVHELQKTDDLLTSQVSRLEHVDQELTAVIEKFTELNPIPSRQFVLTFKTSSGPLAPLIDYLTHPRPDEGLPDVEPYEFSDEHTPFARLGTIPRGVSFGEFTGQLAHDMSAVHASRRRILPRHDWETHPLKDAVISVRRIAQSGTVRSTV